MELIGESCSILKCKIPKILSKSDIKKTGVLVDTCFC